MCRILVKANNEQPQADAPKIGHPVCIREDNESFSSHEETSGEFIVIELTGVTADEASDILDEDYSYLPTPEGLKPKTESWKRYKFDLALLTDKKVKNATRKIVKDALKETRSQARYNGKLK